MTSRTFFLLVLSLSCITGFSQTITAQLLDLKRNPIQGVKVFYDKSTIYTYTNDDGVFEIPRTSEIPNPTLVFYHPNYDIYAISDTDKLRSAYYLREKAVETDTLDSSSELFPAEEMYQVFRENFLGKSENTDETIILNKEVIQLRFDTITNKFFAKASKPIQIQNNALGYHIEYYLKDFEIEYSADSLNDIFKDYKFIHGYSLFKDIDSSKTKERKETYDGTLNYFFKQIINENYSKVKSKVFTDKKRIRLKKLFNVKEIEGGVFKLSLEQEMLKHSDDGDFTFYIQPHYKEEGSRMYYFNMKGDTYHRNKMNRVILFRPYLLVDKYGNPLDEKYFEISGEILEIDLADTLPIDYN